MYPELELLDRYLSSMAGTVLSTGNITMNKTGLVPCLHRIHSVGRRILSKQLLLSMLGVTRGQVQNAMCMFCIVIIMYVLLSADKCFSILQNNPLLQPHSPPRTWKSLVLFSYLILMHLQSIFDYDVR